MEETKAEEKSNFLITMEMILNKLLGLEFLVKEHLRKDKEAEIEEKTEKHRAFIL